MSWAAWPRLFEGVGGLRNNLLNVHRRTRGYSALVLNTPFTAGGRHSFVGFAVSPRLLIFFCPAASEGDCASCDEHPQKVQLQKMHPATCVSEDLTQRGDCGKKRTECVQNDSRWANVKQRRSSEGMTTFSG